MQYYYRSEYGRNGYRKRMLAIRIEIQRNIEDIGHGEVGLGSNEDEGWFLGFDHEGQDVFMKIVKLCLKIASCQMLRRKEAMFL